jgi:cytochrome c peroxidase
MERKKVQIHLYLAIGLLLLVYACKHQAENELTFGPVPGIQNDLRNKEVQLLGKALFFDKRLSADNSIACATCHQPNKAFTDGRRVAVGLNQSQGIRNVPTLINSAYLNRFMADGVVKSLEEQAIVPIQDLKEMGISFRQLIQKLKNIRAYTFAARRLFNRPMDAYVLTRSIAAYERSLIGQKSRFDDYWRGNENALTPSEKQGWLLFKGRLNCVECHPAPRFYKEGTANNGLKSWNAKDNGRYRITGKWSDLNRYKIPSLRNVVLTAPYMHDGSLATLGSVIDFYQKGGNKVANQSVFIHGFVLNSTEKQHLIDFFKSLTDVTFSSINK